MISSAEQRPPRQEIIYLVRGWPRLSQTFVLDEVLGLQRLGVALRVVSLTAPSEPLVQAELSHLTAPVHYLGEVDTRRQVIEAHARAAWAAHRHYLRAVWYTWRHPEWDKGYHVASRWQCLLLAVRLSALLRAGSQKVRAPQHVHAHFAHDPAAVAFLTHVLTGVPWSFTAHARDLWQVPPTVLADRVRSARFAVTCYRDGAERVRQLLPVEIRGRVRLVHHGVDVTSFRPAPRTTGSPRALVVSIGRLVEKKGFSDLLAALRLVADEDRQFDCVIFGEGPLEAEMADHIRHLGLSDRVTLGGARARRELLPVLQQADIFALTPYVTATGDRDGIPNVVVEAMACGIPVVATTAGGIPEVVLHGVSGLLTNPRDVPGIAAHLTLLIDAPQLRARVGAAARRAVLEGFDSSVAVRELAGMFVTTGAVEE